MYQLDIDAARQLAREHQAELRRDWQHANADRPEPIQARGRLQPRRLRPPWIRLRPTYLAWRLRT
jgi:hypothetical protein